MTLTNGKITLKSKTKKYPNLSLQPGLIYWFQNGGQIIEFYFASFYFWPKFEKNTFPNKFFNEIWLKVEEHE